MTNSVKPIGKILHIPLDIRMATQDAVAPTVELVNQPNAAGRRSGGIPYEPGVATAFKVN
jgi:hypothetical protein